ncbi:MAG: pyridoxal phosphate-dependent aminotransferase [Pelagimonas sp.]|jgi:histidinol-phosphate aminotransferase|nr:pyridoxal phosphate-dependent aminotransferase [Pelagimonas sp.]
MTYPRYTDLVAGLPATVPFVGPEEQERDRGRVFKARLGANELVFGPSPKAVVAMQTEAQDAWKYGDAAHSDLKTAMAADLGCAAENLIFGEGIDGLLGNLVRLVVAPGDTVVTSDGAYPTFNYHIAGFGGMLHKVPYREDREDLEALMAKAAEVNAKLVYFANPDNPMGTWVPGDEISRALDLLPEGCLLVLDEAYVEFAPKEAIPNIAFDDPRVIRFRTFSKAYGLAGARVGYGIGAPDLIRSFDKIRNHFGMNRVGLAGALAALQDQDWLRDIQEKVAIARGEIGRIAEENGLMTVESATNFVAVDCGGDAGFARAVLQGLDAQDVFVRMPFVAPQNRCIRISAGRPEDLAILAEALPKALSHARG